jgi:hypothetical protein
MRTILNVRSGTLAALTALTSFAASPLAAQLPSFHPSYYGSTEFDTRGDQFYLLGVYVGVGGLGWSPYLNVNGYSLHYQAVPTLSSSDRNLPAILPTVGLAYASRYNGVSIGGGYAFVNNEDPGAPGAEGGGTDGPTMSFGAYHVGRGPGAAHLQLLSNYNFDSPYLWVRGRASFPFSRSRTHPSRFGLELVGQGGGENATATNVYQIAPTFEYSWMPGLRTTGAAGWKSVGGNRYPSRENATYFKLEFSYSP